MGRMFLLSLASRTGSRHFGLLALSLLAALSVGCAQGGGGDEDGGTRGDSGPRVMRDGGSTTRDGGGRDSGPPTACDTGQHACGGGCVDDLENLPENGCRLGCGTACPAPPDATASCGADGTCSIGCEPPFRLVEGECVCEARTCSDLGFMCGAPDDGCGMALDCGSCGGTGTCIDGACSCAPDARETNDSRLTAPSIGSATDAPDTDLIFDMFNLHTMGDEDWFEISVADDFDGGNPRVRVTLRNIPSGDNYDLAAYYVCDAGGDSSSCSAGTPDNMIGRGCASSASGATSETVEIETECSTTDEAGTLILHITGSAVSGTCANYEIEVNVS